MSAIRGLESILDAAFCNRFRPDIASRATSTSVGLGAGVFTCGILTRSWLFGSTLKGPSNEEGSDQDRTCRVEVGGVGI